MFKLAINDNVGIPVKFTLKAGEVDKKFSFILLAARRSQEDIDAWMVDKSVNIKDILTEVVTGWSGQALVLTEDGPAEFSPEAFAVMLNVAGVANTIYLAYMQGCGAKERS